MSLDALKITCIRLLLAGCFLVGASATGAQDTAASASAEKLRQFMEQVRPPPTSPQTAPQTAGQIGNPAVQTAKTVPPARLQERIELLKTGEHALARLDVDAALQAFDRAAMILHAADTEIALVRAYMQGGEYRRALAFGAHTAGAHLDVVGGSALYAWLLHAGGQPAIAQRLLDEAQSRSSVEETTRQPAPTLLNRVQQQLRSGTPVASGALLALPTRLAPYGSAEGLPKAARVVGSGVLMHNGQGALVPLALVPRTGKLWLRNGLGQLVTAHAIQRFPKIGVARLRLDRALPAAQDLWTADRDAFPGSVGYAVEFVAGPDATPAWPVLHTGFLGGVPAGAPDSGPQRLLGIGLPDGSRQGRGAAARGGPVFDAAGRLLGLAVPGLPGQSGAPDRLLTVSALPKDVREALARSAPKDAHTRSSIDRIYEASLKTALQVITLP